MSSGRMRYAKQPLIAPLTVGGYNGYVVRNTRVSGFKLAIIVGHSTKGDDRLRVRYWRANTSQWTLPVLVRRDFLQALTDDERAQRAGVIDKAIAAAKQFARTVYT